MSSGGKREGAGRKPIAEKSSLVTLRLPIEALGKIPKPVAKWIRNLIIKELENGRI